MTRRDPRGGRGLLQALWAGWKRFGLALGNFQVRALLTLLYFVVVAPFALAVRWFDDPLRMKRRSPSGWLPRGEAPANPLEAARHQF